MCICKCAAKCVACKELLNRQSANRFPLRIHTQSTHLHTKYTQKHLIAHDFLHCHDRDGSARSTYNQV